ncbi:DUF5362 family protein (plasmid) [Brevibacillus halotolerans]|nr:DUF5362 family protein [Brevibacillus halotolerans]
MDYRWRRTIDTISFWSKFMGYTMIFSGGIQVIVGLIPLVLPALFGVFLIFLGILMVKAGKKADEFNRDLSKENLGEMLEYLAKSFKLQGIYTVISIVLAIIILVIAILSGVTNFPHL